MTDAAEQPVSSGLREHIKAEDVRIPRELRQRSTVLIARNAAQPFVFIAVALAVAWVSDAWYVAVPVAAVFFLLAQRSFQTLVHDLSHRLFSNDERRNDLLGNWLAAGWIGSNVDAYRDVHFEHHRKNGSDEDPEFIDMNVIQARGGLRRHIMRYALGLEIFRLLKKYYGPSATPSTGGSSSAGSGIARKLAANINVLLAQAAVAVACWLVGAPYLILVWMYLLATWSPLLSGLRFLVEHPGSTDLTVTTISWMTERSFFAPFHFNYHFEHHAWPSVPPYRLKAVHEYLEEQGFFERHPEYVGSTYLGGLSARVAEVG